MFKNNVEAFNLGRKAFFKGFEEWQNPYDENNEPDKEWSWSRGWWTANKEENDFDWTEQ